MTGGDLVRTTTNDAETLTRPTRRPLEAPAVGPPRQEGESPRAYNHRARLALKARAADEAEAEGHDYSPSCRCHGCLVYGAVQHHERMTCLAPRTSITEFSAFYPWAHLDHHRRP